jgi:hypothetical protein
MKARQLAMGLGPGNLSILPDQASTCDGIAAIVSPKDANANEITQTLRRYAVQSTFTAL